MQIQPVDRGSAGVEFLTEPRDEPYGRPAVFRDIAGNRWDLLASTHQPDGGSRPSC